MLASTWTTVRVTSPLRRHFGGAENAGPENAGLEKVGLEKVGLENDGLENAGLQVDGLNDSKTKKNIMYDSM